MESRWDLPSADRGLLSDVLDRQLRDRRAPPGPPGRVGPEGRAPRGPGRRLPRVERPGRPDRRRGVRQLREGPGRAQGHRPPRLAEEARARPARHSTSARPSPSPARVTAASGPRAPTSPGPPAGRSEGLGRGLRGLVLAGRRRLRRRARRRSWPGASSPAGASEDGRSATSRSSPTRRARSSTPTLRCARTCCGRRKAASTSAPSAHLRLTLEAQHRSVSRNAPLSLGLFPAGVAPALVAHSPRGAARRRILKEQETTWRAPLYLGRAAPAADILVRLFCAFAWAPSWPTGPGAAWSAAAPRACRWTPLRPRRSSRSRAPCWWW